MKRGKEKFGENSAMCLEVTKGHYITCVVSSTTLTANEPFKQTVMMIIKYDDDIETDERRV